MNVKLVLFTYVVEQLVLSIYTLALALKPEPVIVNVSPPFESAAVVTPAYANEVISTPLPPKALSVAGDMLSDVIFNVISFS